LYFVGVFLLSRLVPEHTNVDVSLHTKYDKAMNGQPNYLNGTAYFRQLYIIFAALLTGQVIFMGIALFLVQSGGMAENSDLHGIFSLVVPIVAIGGLLASNVSYVTITRKGKNKEKLSYKLDSYRIANIVRLALLEGPNLFAVVAFLLTGKMTYGVVFIILIVAQMFFKPSWGRCITDLELTPAEQEILTSDQEIV